MTYDVYVYIYYTYIYIYIMLCVSYIHTYVKATPTDSSILFQLLLDRGHVLREQLRKHPTRALNNRCTPHDGELAVIAFCQVAR